MRNRYRKGDGERSSLFTRRALLLGGAQAVLLSALAGRLYQLQVIETSASPRWPRKTASISGCCRRRAG